jgi:hypothetical protein
MSKQPESKTPSDAAACSPWTECADGLPPDFERVVVYGLFLGTFIGSVKDRQWRIETPLRDEDGRRIMVTDCEPPTRWAPIPPKENSEVSPNKCP